MKSHRLALFFNLLISAFFIVFVSQSEASRPINAIIDIKIDDANPKKRISFELKGTDSFTSYDTGIMPPAKPGGHYYFYINIQNSHNRLNNGELFSRQFENPIVTQISITQYTQKSPVTAVIFKTLQATKPQIKARDNLLRIVFFNISTEENESSLSTEQEQIASSLATASALLDDRGKVEQFSSATDSQMLALIKSFLRKILRQGKIIIVIIITLLILVVGTSVGIQLFLRRRIRQSNKKNSMDETYDIVEQLTQMIHQLEEKKEDAKSQKLLKDIQAHLNIKDTGSEMSQLKEGKNETVPEHQKPALERSEGSDKKNQKLKKDIQKGFTDSPKRGSVPKIGTLSPAKPSQVSKTDAEDEMPQLKEGSKKAIHQVQDTTKSKSETAPKHQKLEEYAKSNAQLRLSEDDDISTLAETLTRLANEYEETYQKLSQIITNKYKQLQEASKYINKQTEKLNKLTANNEDMFASLNGLRFIDEIQAQKHPLKYAEVYKLAEQGIDRTEIAQRTKLPVGEVDLLLSLNSTKSQE